VKSTDAMGGMCAERVSWGGTNPAHAAAKTCISEIQRPLRQRQNDIAKGEWCKGAGPPASTVTRTRAGLNPKLGKIAKAKTGERSNAGKKSSGCQQKNLRPPRK
jgi:hypothetical protein